jgi:ornithine cyclodeaminase
LVAASHEGSGRSRHCKRYRLAKRKAQLSDLVTGAVVGRRADNDITIFKSVGVGLQDVALAGLAWRRLEERSEAV